MPYSNVVVLPALVQCYHVLHPLWLQLCQLAPKMAEHDIVGIREALGVPATTSTAAGLPHYQEEG